MQKKGVIRLAIILMAEQSWIVPSSGEKRGKKARLARPEKCDLNHTTAIKWPTVSVSQIGPPHGRNRQDFPASSLYY